MDLGRDCLDVLELLYHQGEGAKPVESRDLPEILSHFSTFSDKNILDRP